MNTAATNRFRGRAGRRLAAALIAATALGLTTTACGPSDAPDSSASAQPTNGSSSNTSGTQGNNGGTPTKAPSGSNGASSSTGGTTGSNGTTGGGGSAHAGNELTLVGKLQYLAPGKLIVKPQGGGTDQAFLVANATTILGAAAICSDDSGSVSVGGDGYGTAKCTVDQLEKAAKTNSVTVRVTMDRKSGGADTVEEKYHP
ncbi:hypothetical protein ACIRPT_24075 [Streptomyces sp. NPDC101227]|uniref:hypothetical protein n=1 Tax=Streptomyces sp. NPDC101227 TaxID=3366136 RepID=UPI00382B9687